MNQSNKISLFTRCKLSFGCLLVASFVLILFAIETDISNAESISTNAVPVEIANNLVIVQARVNGHDGRLLLDTGASTVCLASNIAAVAGIRGGSTTKITDAAELQENEKSSSAKTIGVGTVMFHNVPVTVLTNAPTEIENGLLGLSFLRHYIFCIDYQRKLLSFPSRTGFQKTGSAIPMQYKAGQLIVPFEVDGTPVLVVVDTGMSGALVLRSWFIEAKHLRERYQTHPVGSVNHTLFSNAQPECACVRSLKLGDYVFTNTLVEFQSKQGSSNDGIAGIIGGGILSQFTLTFDIEKGELWLVPGANSKAVKNR